MEIKCTVEELKELIKNTSVAGTTDVNRNILTKEDLDDMCRHMLKFSEPNLL